MSRKGSMRQLRKFVIRTVKNMRHKHVHRVRLIGLNLTSATDVYLTLLQAVDDPVWDNATDGSTTAQCEVGSRLASIKLTVTLYEGSSNERTEMMVFKDPDAFLTTNMTPANLFAGDLSATTMAVRKYTGLYRLFYWKGTGDNVFSKMIMKRSAMKRIGLMKENDNLRVMFSNGTFGTANKADIVGTIISAR